VLTTGTILVSSPAGLNYSIDGTDYSNSTGSFSGLPAGIYRVTARSSYGCTSTAKIDTIIESIPAVPHLTITQPTCTDSTGTITITAPLGTKYGYSIDETTYQSATIFSNTQPGNYTVSVKNNNSGCLSDTAVVINRQPPTPTVPVTTITQPNCLIPTGTITITAPTGTGMSYSIDGKTYHSSAIYPDLVVGTYSVTAQNSNRCISGSTIDSIISPTITLPKSDFTLSTYSIDNKHNSVSGSITPEMNIAYLWNLGDGSTDTGSYFTTHDYNITGNESDIVVSLTATDSIGCYSTTTKTIAVTPFIPNVFTPNGDGHNDYFMPYLEVQVFDRNGIMLYQGDTNSRGWDGTFKGEKASPDTYFYVLIYYDSHHVRQTKKGYVTLVR
jgi:gliding motility-associated-like protein